MYTYRNVKHPETVDALRAPTFGVFLKLLKVHPPEFQDEAES